MLYLLSRAVRATSTPETFPACCVAKGHSFEGSLMSDEGAEPESYRASESGRRFGQQESLRRLWSPLELDETLAH